MNTKFCKYCNAEFDLDSEHWTLTNKKRKNPVLRCIKHKNELNRLSHYKFKGKNNIISRLYAKVHREESRVRAIKYYENNKEKVIQYQKEYLEKNREKVRKRRYKYNSKSEQRIRISVSHAIMDMIKGTQGAFRYLPYRKEELVNHLQSKFKDNMTLNNYGKWQIDHIIPIKYKKKDGTYYWNQDELTNPKSETFQRCWALDNLQPLWKEENISKSNKYIG